MRLWRGGAWQVYPEGKSVVFEGYSDVSIEAMYIEEMRAFLAALEGRAPFPYSFAEDASCLRTLRASDASAETGRRVTIEDMPEETTEPWRTAARHLKME